MAINYKVCPKCGSSKAFLLEEEGKIKLGGCCFITGVDPEYFCKECESEWTRQSAIDHAYKEITGIKASVGGFFGGYYKVDLDFQSRKLKWSHLGCGNETYYDKTIRQSSLDRFIDALKILDLLNWKAKYIDTGVCDGTQWSLEIFKLKGNIRKYGDNQFPDQWDEYCKLISKLSGKTFR